MVVTSFQSLMEHRMFFAEASSINRHELHSQRVSIFQQQNQLLEVNKCEKEVNWEANIAAVAAL